MALTDKTYPDNFNLKTTWKCRYIFFNFGRRGSRQLFHLVNFRVNINSSLSSLSRKNILKKFDCNTPQKSKWNEYWHYHLNHLRCTIVWTKWSNSNHIVTKPELPRGDSKWYSFSILILFSIVSVYPPTRRWHL